MKPSYGSPIKSEVVLMDVININGYQTKTKCAYVRATFIIL